MCCDDRGQLVPRWRREALGGRVALFGHVRFGSVEAALPGAAMPPNYIGAVREPVAACVSMFR